MSSLQPKSNFTDRIASNRPGAALLRPARKVSTRWPPTKFDGVRRRTVIAALIVVRSDRSVSHRSAEPAARSGRTVGPVPVDPLGAQPHVIDITVVVEVAEIGAARSLPSTSGRLSMPLTSWLVPPPSVDEAIVLMRASVSCRVGLGGDITQRAADRRSPPYSVPCGPRSTSMRSTSSSLQIQQAEVQIDLRVIDIRRRGLAQRAVVAAGRESSQHELDAVARPAVDHGQPWNHACEIALFQSAPITSQRLGRDRLNVVGHVLHRFGSAGSPSR